jgi:hypothetical protein
MYDEISKMSTSSILIELLGGSKPGLCDSFDERVALSDREKVIASLMEKRMNEATV